MNQKQNGIRQSYAAFTSSMTLKWASNTGVLLEIRGGGGRAFWETSVFIFVKRWGSLATSCWETVVRIGETSRGGTRGAIGRDEAFDKELDVGEAEEAEEEEEDEVEEDGSDFPPLETLISSFGTTWESMKIE